MLKCHLSIFRRNIATSLVLRNDMPKRFDQEVPSFRPLRENELSRKIEEDKKKLQWRQTIQDNSAFYKSKLKVFDTEENVPSTGLEMMAQPLDISPKAIKLWWSQYKTRREKYLQQFIPERHEILGNDLASASFILFRMGKVKFVGQNEWIEVKEDDIENLPLPNKFDPSYEIEAIKCDNMTLYYEGLENIRRLKKLKYFSLRNVKLFSDWGMDRVSGSEFLSLETLDIRGTSVTANGLQAIYRMPGLKELIADDQPEENIEWHLTVAMLQDILPDFRVVSKKD